MAVLETQRLRLRRYTLDDAPFVMALVNDPDWIANIGDRGVRTLEDARRYMRDKKLAPYERHGFGMYLVELKASGEPIGEAGLVRRDGLDDVDLGFAFLPQFRGQGYAREAAAAVLEHARNDFALKRIVAIVTPANRPSVRLVEKLGFQFVRGVTLPGEDEEISLYALSF